MGFGKTFSLSLVAFIALNFIFSILYLALGPGFDELLNRFNPSSPQYAPLMIIYYLFGAIASVPSILLNWVIILPIFPPNILDFLIIGLGFLIAPLIAAILAGKFAESKLQGFAGWVLTAVISTIALVICIILSPTFEATMTSTYGWSGFELILISLAISCVVNIIFYGFFALLVSKTEYY
ncbi:MAG: hypothetical protein KGD65_12460 [Candidatus Lokiarchaeota archaeon]|nr:hypothetical protein [Candidatus Lokiarchaeota archaeon]